VLELDHLERQAQAFQERVKIYLQGTWLESRFS